MKHMGVQERKRPPYRRKFWDLVVRGGRISMSNWLDILAGVYGDRVTVHLHDREMKYPFFTGTEITYNDALMFVNRIGNGLTSVGITKGDRVIVITSNRIELGLACFAVMKIGAVAVPLNFMFKAPEIRYIAENSGARAMIIDRDVYHLNVKDQAKIPGIDTWVLLAKEDEVPPGFHSFSRLMADASPVLEPIVLDDEEVVIILYTSGTTGFPKGAMLTNAGFSRVVRRFARLAALLRTPRTYLGVFTLPVAHIMGYIMMIANLSIAMPWVFISRFDPYTVLEALTKYQATLFLGVPAMYTMLFQAMDSVPGKYDLTSMRFWGSAADAMPVEYIRRLKKTGGARLLGIRLPAVFFEGYGQVETLGITTMRRSWIFGSHTPGCVGKPARRVKVRIVDEQGRDVKRGGVGELWVKGPRLMKGYWNAPDMNRKVFVDGWFRTGDLMRQDRLGRLYFVDREKDMIKVGGYSVFSGEVEEEMRHHPKISEAAVIGVPDSKKGHIPLAVIVLKGGEKAASEEILAWAKENIADYKAPRRVEIVDELPKGMTLKVMKKELRERFSGAQNPSV